jgi:hypothetical protein
MSEQIDKVYAKGDYVGSLVVPGPRDKLRPTNWSGDANAHFNGLWERWMRWGGAPQPLKAK